ncbi:MAG: hypothetical protein Q7R93_03060 [bacterium]|nr:hypothetical protein [bacterium]
MSVAKESVQVLVWVTDPRLGAERVRRPDDVILRYEFPVITTVITSPETEIDWSEAVAPETLNVAEVVVMTVSVVSVASLNAA